MSRMRQFTFLHSVFQPTESRGIAQSAENLQLFGSDVIMLFEMFHQNSINFNLTDIFRTLRILGSQKLGYA